MGDRIAMLKEGGHLAQYATPAELLMAPADAFVEDFVGADRALKRLALLRVADIDLWEAPLAHVGQATSEVRAKLEGAEVPHALVDRLRAPAARLALGRRPRPRDGPGQARHQPPPDPRPRRRDARCALRPAPGRDPLRARRRRRRPDRRGALGRDHLRVPHLARGAHRRALRPPSARWPRRPEWSPRSSAGCRCWPRAAGFVREPGESTDATCVGRQRHHLPRLGDRQHRPLRDAHAQHLALVLPSVALGFAIAFGLALLSHRRRWLIPAFTGITGVIYTLPSIALFLLLLPITGRGNVTAIIALTLYNLQIIYRNIVIGLANVPERVQGRRAGDGDDRPPAAVAGRAAAGAAGDHRRAADRDGLDGRDRDPGASSPAPAASAPRSTTTSPSRPGSSSAA